MAKFELRMVSPNDPLVGDLPLLIRFTYTSDYAYEVEARETAGGFSWSLVRRPVKPQISRENKWMPFEANAPNARGYAAFLDDEAVGYVEYSHEAWTNLVRVWHFYVRVGFRRMGIGTKLMENVVQAAKHFRARGIVVETQSCNVPAIDFYRSRGFTFWAIDVAKYSNDDIARKEVMIGMGKTL